MSSWSPILVFSMPDWQAIIFPDMENGAPVALPPVAWNTVAWGQIAGIKPNLPLLGCQDLRASLSSERPFSPLHTHTF
jgi:hypothetical protein